MLLVFDSVMEPEGIFTVALFPAPDLIRLRVFTKITPVLAPVVVKILLLAPRLRFPEIETDTKLAVAAVADVWDERLKLMVLLVPVTVKSPLMLPLQTGRLKAPVSVVDELFCKSMNKAVVVADV